MINRQETHSALRALHKRIYGSSLGGVFREENSSSIKEKPVVLEPQKHVDEWGRITNRPGVKKIT